MACSSEMELAGERIAAGLVATEKIRGDDEIDTALLRTMAEDAKRYLASFSWCETILDSYFGEGTGGIFAVFFFHIRPNRPEVDTWIWGMVGDVPPAYLPLADCESPADAFRSYMRGMSKWVDCARRGKTGSPEQGVPPVNLPATPVWAEKIDQKLYGLTLTVRLLFEDPADSSESVH